MVMSYVNMFLLFSLPYFVVIFTADSLSMCSGVGCSVPMTGCMSNRTRRNHCLSCRACDAARYSASQVLSAIVF